MLTGKCCRSVCSLLKNGNRATIGPLKKVVCKYTAKGTVKDFSLGNGEGFTYHRAEKFYINFKGTI